MSADQTSLFCPRCEKPTLHARGKLGFGWGCLLTLLTGGLFLPVWLLLGMLNSTDPWRCQTCGKTQSSVGGRLALVIFVLVLLGAVIALFRSPEAAQRTMDKVNPTVNSGAPAAPR